MREIKLLACRSDLCLVEADVLVLKYAGRFHGSDAAVVDELSRRIPRSTLKPTVDGYALVETLGQVHAKHVLFVPTVDPAVLDARSLQSFASRCLSILETQIPYARRVATVLHGVSVGLTVTDSFEAIVAGFRKSVEKGNFPASLEEIIFVEDESSRFKSISQLLTYCPSIPKPAQGFTTLNELENLTASSPSAFVAMSFSEGEMKALFERVLKPTLTSVGLLCERADRLAYTGEIVAEVLKRIDRAAIVIAEVSTENPNVMIEIGYAWGKNRPTMLIAKEGTSLPFNLRSQRCLMYRDFRDLARQLLIELASLRRRVQ